MKSPSKVVVAVFAMLTIGSTVLAADATYQGYQIVNVVVDGKPLVSDVPPVSLNGRTVLPLRAVAELAGMDVQWDAASNTATLTSRFTVAQFNELQSDNQLLTAKSAVLQRDENRLTGELNSVQRDLATTQTEVKRLTSELDAAKKDVESVKVELQTAKKDLETAQAEVKRLTAAATTKLAPATATPILPPLKTAKEIQDYLQANYATINTDAGPLSLTYAISGPNDYKWVPYDYSVRMDWEPFLFFDNLEERISITPAMKAATIAKLKEHTKLVYDLVSKALPGKKLYGSYYKSWYRYPAIQEDLVSRRYLSWQNYDGTALSNYADTKLSTFSFNPYIDTVKY